MASASKIIVDELNGEGQLNFNAQLKLRGVPSSHGIAYAPSIIVQPEKIIETEEKIEPNQIDSELARFQNAINNLGVCLQIFTDFQKLLAGVETCDSYSDIIH